MLWYGYLACTPLNTTSIWWHHGWHRSAVLQSHPYTIRISVCALNLYPFENGTNSLVAMVICHRNYWEASEDLLQLSLQLVLLVAAAVVIYYNFEYINLELRLCHTDAFLLLCCVQHTNIYGKWIKFVMGQWRRDHTFCWKFKMRAYLAYLRYQFSCLA